MIENPRYGTIDPEYVARLVGNDDGPVWMVNLISYREFADYGDGPATISGRRADKLYSPLEVLADIGAEVAFFGDVIQQRFNDGPRWDRVVVVKYPTRRAFMEMQDRPDYIERHVHKEAAIAQMTIAGCVAMPQPAYPEGLSEVAWEAVAHPSTVDDGPVIAVDVIRFDDAAAAAPTPTEIEADQCSAVGAGLPQGLRVNGWFAVEGSFVGDGRSWHQIRFNEFPSLAAFMAMDSDPARSAAHSTDRSPAIADAYTLLVRAHTNRLVELR